jgi:hypothetical protein
VACGGGSKNIEAGTAAKKKKKKGKKGGRGGSGGSRNRNISHY